MANIKVGIVEDEMIIAEGISDALISLGYAPTEPAISYTEALEMVERERPDILLLDVVLSGKKDGIDVAAKVKELYNIPFIFLTANADAATVERAKQLQPPAYLVKPFNKDELYTSIEICLHNFATQQQNKTEKDNYLIKDALFIKQGNKFHKVKVADILYLESDNVYIYVHTAHNKFMVRSTLQHYLELINDKHFFKVYRSFVINLPHIESFSADSVFINGREIPIGKSYKDELMHVLRLG